jgi:hypothetical protein
MKGKLERAKKLVRPDMIRSYESGNKSALKNLSLHLTKIRSA